jgi:hypothetical protein
LTTAEQIIRFLLEKEDEDEGWRTPAWAIQIGGKLYTGETPYAAIEDAFLSGAFSPEHPPGSLGFWPDALEILRQRGAKIVMRPLMREYDLRDDFSQGYNVLKPAKRRLGDDR